MSVKNTPAVALPMVVALTRAMTDVYKCHRLLNSSLVNHISHVLLPLAVLLPQSTLTDPDSTSRKRASVLPK